MDNLPSMPTRWLDLEEHVLVTEFDSGLVNNGGDTVFVGKRAEMGELVVVEVGDIHSELVMLIPEILSEVIDCLGGVLGVKLGIQRVPVWLSRGENTNNVLHFGNTILHFKPEEFYHYKFHCIIGVISAMYAADVIYINCTDRLKTNSSFSFVDNFHVGTIAITVGCYGSRRRPSLVFSFIVKANLNTLSIGRSRSR